MKLTKACSLHRTPRYFMLRLSIAIFYGAFERELRSLSRGVYGRKDGRSVTNLPKENGRYSKVLTSLPFYGSYGGVTGAPGTGDGERVKTLLQDASYQLKGAASSGRHDDSSSQPDDAKFYEAYAAYSLPRAHRPTHASTAGRGRCRGGNTDELISSKDAQPRAQGAEEWLASLAFGLA